MNAARDSGKPIPESLLNVPTLSECNLFYWIAFLELNTCRGEGYIPWTAINEYAKRYNLGEEMFEEFVEMIMELDSKFLDIKERARESNGRSK